MMYSVLNCPGPGSTTGGTVRTNIVYIVQYLHRKLTVNKVKELLLTLTVMPVHSLLFINSSTSIIFSKYFLFNYISNLWKRLSFEKYLLQYFRNEVDMNDSTASTDVGSFSVDEISIVHRMMGDFMVIACGTDDIDEIVCKCDNC